MTIEELYAIVEEQQKEIKRLQINLKRLTEQVEYNEAYEMELINALTETVDRFI